MRAETWNFSMILTQKSMRCAMCQKVDSQSNSAVANIYVRFSSHAISSKYLCHLNIWNLDNLFMDMEPMWLHWPRCGAHSHPSMKTYYVLDNTTRRRFRPILATKRHHRRILEYLLNLFKRFATWSLDIAD